MIGHKQSSVRHCPSMQVIRFRRRLLPVIFSLPPTSSMPATLAPVVFWLCTTVSVPPSSASAFSLFFLSSPFSQHGDLQLNLKTPHKEAHLFYATLGGSVLQTGVLKSVKTVQITASLLAGSCNLCRLNLTNDCLER